MQITETGAHKPLGGKQPIGHRAREKASMLVTHIRTMIPLPHTSAHEVGATAYSRNPMMVYWETTQACALACRHCRAEASLTPHSGELTHAEGMTLLRQIAGFTPP